MGDIRTMSSIAFMHTFALPSGWYETNLSMSSFTSSAKPGRAMPE